MRFALLNEPPSKTNGFRSICRLGSRARLVRWGYQLVAEACKLGRSRFIAMAHVPRIAWLALIGCAELKVGHAGAINTWHDPDPRHL